LFCCRPPPFFFLSLSLAFPCSLPNNNLTTTKQLPTLGRSLRGDRRVRCADCVPNYKKKSTSNLYQASLSLTIPNQGPLGRTRSGPSRKKTKTQTPNGECAQLPRSGERFSASRPQSAFINISLPSFSFFLFSLFFLFCRWNRMSRFSRKVLLAPRCTIALQPNRHPLQHLLLCFSRSLEGEDLPLLLPALKPNNRDVFFRLLRPAPGVVAGLLRRGPCEQTNHLSRGEYLAAASIPKFPAAPRYEIKKKRTVAFYDAKRITGYNY